MTDREKAIVMAHTGICMLEGEKLGVFYQYLNELYGRPVYTHEWVILDIKEKSKPDFLQLCKEEEPSAERNERMTGCNIEMPEGLRWVPIEEEAPPEDNALVTIKWAENDYEVCEIDFYNWTKTAKEKVTAWMRMPEPYKGGGGE